ncbi:NUDIX hydrolase [Streptomyces sp. NBC_01198]|uniref:NUDIX hydrolase n=1 Tax=Streptomyces sp. NBC_01198 TaxID=2903769 RepID=UPI002E1416F6|nr:NUDIX hydrolase [Streptomyces sp. NBC_01198]
MAHADTDPKSPPPRRAGCVVVILDPDEERVLLVKPRYGSPEDNADWQLPGGHAHTNEPIEDAAMRELAEETGLLLHLTHLLLVDQMLPKPERETTEGVNYVFDGGAATAEEVATTAIPEAAAEELADLRWVPLGELDSYTHPYQARRIRAALENSRSGLRMHLHRRGVPVGS